MTRYHLEWIPRASWQTGVDAADQRWTRTPNLFVGSEVEATQECSDLECAYDRNCIFRAVPIAVTPEEEQHHFCSTCGGDLRDRLGGEYACSCPVAVAVPGSVRWIRPVRGEEKAS